MGHVAGLGPEYRKYLRRLEAGPVALPEPADSQAQRGLQEILEILLSPEEAALAARLPHRPKTLDALAARTGIPPKQLEEKLDRLADRGIVLDLVSRRSGDKKYLLAPPVVGFFEFSMMRIRDSIPKKRMAEALSSYMFGDPAFAREVFEDVTPIGRALVHEGAIDDGALGGDASAGCAPGASAPAAAPAVDGYPEVLEWERLSAAVENAQRFSLTNCYCRHKAQHLGTACDVPLETCISFDGSADFLLRHDFAWEIERAEVLEVFQMCREQGLVQIADNVQQRPGYVCNCCGCCCAQLQAVRRYDIPAVIPSGFFAGSELSECTGCSRCARSCPVGAISMVPDPGASAGEGEAPARRRRTSLVPQVDSSRCLGCAVCVGSCRQGAMNMHRRRERPDVPVNKIEYVVRRALERGRLPDLLFDEADGRGSLFMNRILRAITALPAVDRVLAADQVKSRFVRKIVELGSGQ